MQITRTPCDTLTGAPKGTNAGYFYAEMFAEVARATAGRLLIGGGK